MNVKPTLHSLLNGALNLNIYSKEKVLNSWMCLMRRMGWVRTLGGMWVGRQVRVAGGELIVADVRRHHEPLHDHDVHRDEVVLDGRDTLGPLWGAPVLFQEESRLSLRFQRRLNEL